MEVYSRKGCTSCTKAETFLSERGVAFQRRDLFKNPLSAAELNDVLRRHGLTARDILSVRSRPYRDLKLADRALSHDELLDLMSRYPALIRRPLVVTDDDLVIGFDQAGLSRLIGDA